MFLLQSVVTIVTDGRLIVSYVLYFGLDIVFRHAHTHRSWCRYQITIARKIRVI
jgi:hypothetical protein